MARELLLMLWSFTSEENAAASQPESERDVDRGRGVEITATAAEGQFEDAAEPRGGLGFSTRGIGFSSSSAASSSMAGGFTRGTKDESTSRPHYGDFNGSRYPSNDKGTADRQTSRSPMLDEFGRKFDRSQSGGMMTDTMINMAGVIAA